MKLNLDKIKEITFGAERIIEQDGLINFYRFSKQEEELYSNMHPQFTYKTLHTAGVTMCFETDATAMKIDIDVVKDIKTSTYFSLDVFSNNTYVGSIKNFNEEEDMSGYDLRNFPLGEYHGKFMLDGNRNVVKIIFPWSVVTRLKSIELENASFVNPIKCKKRLLAYGDSITHGFHSMYTSNTYAIRLANALDATIMNKAIGAEVYFPELAQKKSDFDPDIVTVAYGTNDWVSVNRKTFIENCRCFLQSIRNNYPRAKIIVITPIWRADNDRTDGFSDFYEIDDIIRDISKDIENIHVVNGIDLVPHDKKLFGDLRIHPDDNGFEYYANALLRELSNEISI